MSTENVTQLPAAVKPGEERRSILRETAHHYGMEPDAFEQVIRKTCMPMGADEPTREEFTSFLIVARAHELNPITREIWALKNKKSGGIVAVVSIDGWSTLINRHPQMNGMEFIVNQKDDGTLDSITCKIYRKDRQHPTVITEFLSECRRETDPWKTMPNRMLRHRALVQCARYAFGFAGIYEEDEAAAFTESNSEIIDGKATVVPQLEAPQKPTRQRRQKSEPSASPAVTPAPDDVVASSTSGVSSSRDLGGDAAEAPTAGASPPALDSTDAVQPIGDGAQGTEAASALASVPASLSDEIEDADVFDEDAVLRAIENELGACSSLKDIDEVVDSHEEAISNLTQAGGEQFDEMLEATRSSISATLARAAAEKGDTQQSPASAPETQQPDDEPDLRDDEPEPQPDRDPYEVRDSFEDKADHDLHMRACFAEARKSQDKANWPRVRAVWTAGKNWRAANDHKSGERFDALFKELCELQDFLNGIKR
jgi:phage recombination protein Bet